MGGIQLPRQGAAGHNGYQQHDQQAENEQDGWTTATSKKPKKKKKGKEGNGGQSEGLHTHNNGGMERPPRSSPSNFTTDGNTGGAAQGNRGGNGGQVDGFATNISTQNTSTNIPRPAKSTPVKPKATTNPPTSPIPTTAPVHPSRERPERHVTADTWTDVLTDNIPVSMSQILADQAPAPLTPPTPTSLAQTRITTWLSTHSTYGISPAHQDLIIQHLLHYFHPEIDATWPSTLRQILWRHVIRASYFWVKPDTGLEVGKPEPVHRPEGVYENDFRVWLMCAAERADRVGRDLPTGEWVEAVEREVRVFLSRIEGEVWKVQWGELCFALMFEEERKRSVSLTGLREKIGTVMGGRVEGFEWEGCEMLKPGEGERGGGKGVGGGGGPKGKGGYGRGDVAGEMWGRAMVELRGV